VKRHLDCPPRAVYALFLSTIILAADIIAASRRGGMGDIDHGRDTGLLLRSNF
jgi:hypothetical protein